MKQGEEEEVRGGEGGDGRQRARQAVQILQCYGRCGSTYGRLTRSCCSLQCHGNSGAGWSDLRMWRIRWKLIPQLRGVLFSRNEQVRALHTLHLIHLFVARVVPCHGTAEHPGCKRNTVNDAEKPLYLNSRAASLLAGVYLDASEQNYALNKISGERRVTGTRS